MKVPPKKPHFFKPILPGFKDKFKIPKGFLKYLKGHDHVGRAILKRSGKKWLVKLNGRGLEDGWKKFAEELNLQLGDLLIFRHEGDMEFEVSIFDSISCCERQYGTEENAVTSEETSDKYEFKEKLNTSIKASSHGKTAAQKPFGHSSFVCTIKSYGLLYVPKHFAYANGLLADKKYDLIIKDETQRSWNLRIYSCKTYFCIGCGCRKFIADNCLKEGDYIVFEVVTDGETPIWKFRVVTDAETPMRKFQADTPKPNIMSSHKAFDKAAEKLNTSIKSSIKASSHGKSSAHKPCGHSHFVCTIKPYCLTNGILCVPKRFAYANGLIANKKYDLIIKDETQRSWNLRINSFITQVFIGDGFRKFIADNCLKEGDHIMFEVVTDGETPIWKFHVVTDAETPMRKFQAITDLRHKTSDVATPILQTPASTSADANPHFISTIRHYTFTKAVFCLPMDFVRSNGLMSRSEMILVDEKQRSWSVCLGQMNQRHFGIKSGWARFRKANNVQEGDTYKFELTNNGTIPIVHVNVLVIKGCPVSTG